MAVEIQFKDGTVLPFKPTTGSPEWIREVQNPTPPQNIQSLVGNRKYSSNQQYKIKHLVAIGLVGTGQSDLYLFCHAIIESSIVIGVDPVMIDMEPFVTTTHTQNKTFVTQNVKVSKYGEVDFCQSVGFLEHFSVFEKPFETNLIEIKFLLNNTQVMIDKGVKILEIE